MMHNKWRLFSISDGTRSQFYCSNLLDPALDVHYRQLFLSLDIVFLVSYEEKSQVDRGG
jgi:hypothetical protein